jgi:hypothetical protein
MSTVENALPEKVEALPHSSLPIDHSERAIEPAGLGAVVPEVSRTQEQQNLSSRVDEEMDEERARIQLLRSNLSDKESEFERISRSLTKTRRKGEALHRREESLQHRWASLLSERDEALRAREELGTWIGHRQRSYGWRLVTALRSERSMLDGDVDGLWQRLNAPLTVQPSVLRAMRSSFSRSVVAWFVIVVLVVLLVLLLGARYPALGIWEHWLNVFSWPIWVVLLAGLATYLLIFLLALLAYHRKWSGFWSLLRTERARTAIYRDAITQLRQENQRMKGTHDQVPTYLRLMSEVIHRPWTMTAAHAGGAEMRADVRVDAAIVSTWGVFSRPDTARIPSLMRLAETPSGGGGPEANELVRRSIVRILHQGWRREAYEQLLREAEIIRGIPAGTFTPERLDREPRVRESFLQALVDGQAQVSAGMTHLRDLYSRIQEDLIEQVHPKVQRLDPDPLMGLDLSIDLLEEMEVGDTGWDELLCSILGAPAAWSPTAFTLAGLSNDPVVHARAYGPVRFAENDVDPSVAYLSQKDLVASSLEMTVRIDTLPERVSPSHLHAFVEPLDLGTQQPETEEVDEASPNY